MWSKNGIPMSGAQEVAISHRHENKRRAKDIRTSNLVKRHLSRLYLSGSIGLLP